jgi:hypothetical protein
MVKEVQKAVNALPDSSSEEDDRSEEDSPSSSSEKIDIQPEDWPGALEAARAEHLAYYVNLDKQGKV